MTEILLSILTAVFAAIAMYLWLERPSDDTKANPSPPNLPQRRKPKKFGI